MTDRFNDALALIREKQIGSYDEFAEKLAESDDAALKVWFVKDGHAIMSEYFMSKTFESINRTLVNIWDRMRYMR